MTKLESGVPFGAETRTPGISVPLLYIPHRDPQHPSFRPIPNPRTDPYWVVDLDKLDTGEKTAPEMIVADVTIPSAGSEAVEEPPASNENLGFAGSLLYLPHRDPRHPSFRPVPNPRSDPYWMAEQSVPTSQGVVECATKNDLEIHLLPAGSSNEAGDSEELDAYSEAEVAVVQEMQNLSLPASEEVLLVPEEGGMEAEGFTRDVHTADGTRSYFKGQPGLVIGGTGADDSMTHVSEPVETAMQLTSYPRIDHRLDNKQLNNVLFDSDGHIGFNAVIHATPAPPGPLTLVHVDDPQSATDALASASLSEKARAIFNQLSRPTSCTARGRQEPGPQEMEAEPTPQEIKEEPTREEVPELNPEAVDPEFTQEEVQTDNAREEREPAQAEGEAAQEEVTESVVQIMLPLGGELVSSLAVAESTAPATRTAMAAKTTATKVGEVNSGGWLKCSVCGGNCGSQFAADACDPSKVLECVRACECVREWRELALRCRVSLLYQSWGLSVDDAHTDVVTCFQRVGTVQKRHALALGSCQRRNANLELNPWGLAHIRLILTVNSHPVLVECVQEDQVVRCIKDFLWILYNNGAPLDLTIIDHLADRVGGEITSAHTAGKFYSASVTAIQLLQGLVQAWGCTFNHLKAPMDEPSTERQAAQSYCDLLKRYQHTKCA